MHLLQIIFLGLNAFLLSLQSLRKTHSALFNELAPSLKSEGTHLWKAIVTQVLLLSSINCLECPFTCQCYQQSGINSIFCVNTNHRYIPNYFDFEVKLANISGNILPHITHDSFRNQHYRSLEILDLRRNGIVKIDKKAFYRLKNLLEIDLSRNLLRSINHKMFSGNRFLNKIILSGNPITEIKHYAFPLSIYLRHLDFQGCRIKKIHENAFINSPMVEYLNLKDNDLKSLSLNVLHNSSQLNQLLLDGNPLRCTKQLWLLLKWLKEQDAGKSSLLCVYDETDNAILWDTMDINNVAKFESYPTWIHKGKKRRSRKAFLNTNAVSTDSDESDNESGFSSLHDDILSKVKLRQNSSLMEVATSRVLDPKTRMELTDRWKRNHKNTFTFSPDIQAGLIKPTTNEIYSNESSRSSLESEIPGNAIDMNVLLSLIAIEFALLVVLLYILYKLWKWNKQGCEQGANTPLNNFSKNSKTYDTNSIGYKRYSLSDDNFSLSNNLKEENKFDAESGYLSYHRYNSIEGVTNSNNEFAFYKRYPLETSPPHSQNLNSTEDSSESSVIGPRSHDNNSNENKRSASLRRNSSIRSLGQKMKMNPYNRSISVDTATDCYNVD